MIPYQEGKTFNRETGKVSPRNLRPQTKEKSPRHVGLFDLSKSVRDT